MRTNAAGSRKESATRIRFTALRFEVEEFNRAWYYSYMEKQKPHYALSRVKALIQAGAYRVTRLALHCATRDFGFVQASELADCVVGLSSREFYKSMTTVHDSTLWQDVYHPEVEGRRAYVKVQIVDDTTVVISFKDLEGD